jgi:hypothetical protein
MGDSLREASLCAGCLQQFEPERETRSRGELVFRERVSETAKTLPAVRILISTIQKATRAVAEALAAGSSAVAFKVDGTGGLMNQVRTVLPY